MKSIKYHFQGISITLQQLFQGKYLYYFIPGGVVTVIYWYIHYSVASYEEAIDLTTGYSWLDWGTSYIETGISGMFSFMDVIFEQIYIFVVLTLLSPFNTSLGEKLDSQLTGKAFNTSIIRFINDFIRMIFVVMLVIFLELAFIVIYWMISWMFGLDAIDGFVYHIIAAFFFGFSFYDFALERYEQGVFSSLYYAFANPLSMIITGSIFLLIYNIPIVGIPLAPVLAVMISTVVYLYLEGKLTISKEITTTKDNNE